MLVAGGDSHSLRPARYSSSREAGERVGGEDAALLVEVVSLWQPPVRGFTAMPFASSDEVHIYYEAHGQGAALLLVPGIPAISSDWFPFADRLSERFQVVVYDNRGSGRSDAPPGPYSTRQLAADAVAVLDEVG